ncbi:dextranase-like [Haliotis rubra]|uniref:dextranase-like n=1 Tax=Haliotis rubra TaxID=36100 RepID=UPI001EE6158E|nr:dextranase-like [Haliotis rubra]
MVGLCVLVVLVTLAYEAVGNVIVYPHAKGPAASNKFKVYVSQGGRKHESFTYISTSDQRSHEASHVHPGRSMSFTSFAFAGGSVTVEVHTQRDFHNCIVRPKSYNYHCRRTGTKVAQFTVSNTKKWMSVEFDYDYGSSNGGPDITDRLLVFADPPETHKPNKNDNSVLYYDVGLHNLNGQKQLDSHVKEVYLAPGAYVQGGFKTTGNQPVKIYGRGIVSTSIYKWHDSRFEWSIINMDKGHSHVVEGIIMVDPEEYFYRGLSDHNTVRYVKMVGSWAFNSDGVGIGHDGLVEDCFICANDDALKVYTDNMVAQRVVIWQMQNGAVFQNGWWSGRDMKKVRISDIDVIHTDWCTFKGSNCQISDNDAVFDLAGDTKHFAMSDVVFTNIRVEGSCPRIVYWKMANGASGTASNVRIVNLSVESQPGHDSLHNEIAGNSGGRVTNWQFNNFKIGGKCISNPGQADFHIDAHTTSNIQFHCGGSIIG